jgi:polysaccharide export outer membrane protein
MVDPTTYAIGPENALSVLVWQQPALNCRCVVRADGMITLPLIGEIKAAGLTLVQLKQAIEDELSARALPDPHVTLGLSGHSRKYYIYGQVIAPGEHDLLIPTTVLQAIVSAGGLQEFANREDITIVRGDQRLKFNFKEVLMGKNPSQNVYLESGDMIIVK